MLQNHSWSTPYKAHVVFGGVVFVYFPDRAGGEIEWLSTLGSGGTAFDPFSARLPSLLAVSHRQSTRPTPPTATAPGLPAEETEPEKTGTRLLRHGSPVIEILHLSWLSQPLSINSSADLR